MKKLLVATLLSTLALAGFSQSEEPEKQYYLDISVGYNIGLPPFTTKGNSQMMLKPHSGGSMSFSLLRKIGDDWGLQIEVLSAVFKVKESDFRSYFSGDTPSQINLNGYNSTFFGVGGVKMIPVGASRFVLDLKGSVGLYLTEYAKQQYVQKDGDVFKSVEVDAKRAYSPGLLAGVRLRYPVGQVVDLGVKVEYGLSYASFKVNQSAGAVGPQDVPVITELGNKSKTISFVNTAFTIGVKF